MPSIKRLDLHSEDPGELVRFYADRLGLPSGRDGAIQAGKTELCFAKAESPAIYHFAFNVPSNKIEDAADWLDQQGIPIRLASGRRIVDFPNWNAHAVYFQDPLGNILEFIARHDLLPGEDRPFSTSDILGVSEIGIVVGDVPATVEEIRAELGFEVYKDSLSAEFAALGDHEGMLIVVRTGRAWFGSPGLTAAAFPANVEFEGEQGRRLTLKEGYAIDA